MASKGKESKPNVSVIIPTYNRADLVGRAIQSVLDQTYKDFELIVVDDASEDNTKEVVNDFDDSRIKFIRHKKNRGGSAARNTGAENANGEYLAFLDSDDIWYAGFIEKQFLTIENSSSKKGMVMCGMIKYGRGKKKQSIPSMLNFDQLLTFQANLNGTSSFFVRQNVFKSIGGYEKKLKSFQDFDFLLRTAKEYCIEVNEEILVEHRLRDDSISLDMPAKAQGLELIIERYRKDILRLDVMYLYLFKLGHYYILSNKWEKGLLSWLRSLKFRPGNFKTWKHLLVSLGGPRIYRYALDLHRKRAKNDHK